MSKWAKSLFEWMVQRGLNFFLPQFWRRRYQTQSCRRRYWIGLGIRHLEFVTLNSSPSAVGNPHQGQGGGVHVENVGVADEGRRGPEEVGFSLQDGGLV